MWRVSGRSDRRGEPRLPLCRLLLVVAGFVGASMAARIGAVSRAFLDVAPSEPWPVVFSRGLPLFFQGLSGAKGLKNKLACLFSFPYETVK